MFLTVTGAERGFLLLRREDGSFQAGATLPTGSGPIALATADLSKGYDYNALIRATAWPFSPW